IGQDLRVVGPARRAHQHTGDAGPLGQRQRQAHGARATGRLHAVDPPAAGWVFAEYVRHQRVDEAHVAFGPEVGLGSLLVHQPLLGRLDRAEHRGLALAGTIDADAEVDFVDTRVGVVEL